MLLSKLVDRDDSITSDTDISAITVDSRAVVPGTLFAAMPGSKVDGLSFVQDALAAGAAALLVPEGASLEGVAVPVMRSRDVRRAVARSRR